MRVKERRTKKKRERRAEDYRDVNNKH